MEIIKMLENLVLVLQLSNKNISTTIKPSADDSVSLDQKYQKNNEKLTNFVGKIKKGSQ